MIKVYSSVDRHLTYDIGAMEMQKCLDGLIKQEKIDEASIVNVQTHKDGCWLTTVIFVKEPNVKSHVFSDPDL